VGKHCSKTKTMWGNIVTIHSVIFEKTTKLNSQLTQYKKKIDKDQFEKKIIKRKKKNHVGKYCSNPHCFKEKNYITKFLTNLIFKKIGKDNFENKNKNKKIKKTKEEEEEEVNFEKKHVKKKGTKAKKKKYVRKAWSY
jgi:hypothetical protein